MEGKGIDLFLSVPSRLSDSVLINLIALFYRYKLDMGQLAPLVLKGKGALFRDPRAVFPKKDDEV